MPSPLFSAAAPSSLLAKSLTVDIHTHILPEQWPDLRERYGYGGFIWLEHHKPCYARMMQDDKFFREIQDNCWDPAARLREYNGFGV